MTDGARLPQLATVFQQLLAGRHLSVEDGEIFDAVRLQPNAYSEIFGSLGYELVSHARGFYFFAGANELSPTARQIAVFFFILVEAIGDLGKDVERTIFDDAHALADLPHFSKERYRECLRQVNCFGEDDLKRIIRQMVHLGFVEGSAERFRFRTPAHRLLEMCVHALTVSGERVPGTPPTDVSGTPPADDVNGNPELEFTEDVT